MSFPTGETGSLYLLSLFVVGPTSIFIVFLFRIIVVIVREEIEILIYG